MALNGEGVPRYPKTFLEMNQQVEPSEDPFQGVKGSVPLSWQQARWIADRLGISVSEFVRGGMKQMMREKHPALPEDFVKLYHGILGETDAGTEHCDRSGGRIVAESRCQI